MVRFSFKKKLGEDPSPPFSHQEQRCPAYSYSYYEHLRGRILEHRPMWCVWKLIKSVWGFTVHVTYTPSVPNYKSFQEPWRVKNFQVWLNLNNKIIIFTISIKYHRFFISHIFIVYLFDVINFCVSLYNFGQTLRWFDSSRFLEWRIVCWVKSITGP